MANLDSTQTFNQKQFRTVHLADTSARRETVVHGILTTMLYLTLWRASGCWYGYPANFGDGDDGGESIIVMKILLYSILLLIGLYTLIAPAKVVALIIQVPKLLWVVIFCSLVSIMQSIEMGASIRGAASVIVLALGALLYRQRYGTERTYKALTIFVIIVAYGNLLYTLAFPQFAIMGGANAGAVKGAFYHKNGLGQLCAISLMLLFSMPPFWHRLSYMNFFRWGAIACLAILILLSKSSTSVVTTVLGIGIIVLVKTVHSVPSRMIRTIATAGIFGAVIVSSSILYLGVAQALADFFGKDLTFSGRTHIWDQLIPLIYDRPMWGYGFSTFKQPDVMERYVAVTFGAKSTHNTYIELVLNIGVLGAFSWFLFFLSRLFRKFSSPSPNPRIARWQAVEIATMIMVMVGAMTEAGLFLSTSIIWPQTVLALCALGEPMRRGTPAKDRTKLRPHTRGKGRDYRVKLDDPSTPPEQATLLERETNTVSE